jgi:hypothetical protein
VLEALGADLAADEFDQMEQLCAITGVAIPENLRTLRGKEEKHTGVISKDAMLPFVLGL